MTDYSEQGAVPVDDAADLPTEQEVREAQAVEYPDQAATATGRPGSPGALRPVVFTLPADLQADSIALAGDFNDWSTTSHELRRNEVGAWTIDLELPAGDHRYRFYIDDQRWENDFQADAYEPNPYGGDDSVVHVD